MSEPPSETPIAQLSTQGQTLENQTVEQIPSSSDLQIQEWETRVRAWLSTLPIRRNVMMIEMEAWVDSNMVTLPQELKVLPRPELYKRLLSISKHMRRSNQAMEANQVEHPASRFQRTDQWIPVYSWLESLETKEVVKSKQIDEWLSKNPKVKEQLYARHSRYHLMHYVQKCHLKMLKRREKQKGIQYSAPTSQAKVQNIVVTTAAVPLQCSSSSIQLKDNDKCLGRRNEAFRKYELLTDLENHLSSILSKQKQVNLKDSGSQSLLRQGSAEDTKQGGIVMNMSSVIPRSQGVSVTVAAESNLRSPFDLISGKRKDRSVDTVIPAWSYSEASSDVILTDQPSNSECEEVRSHAISHGRLQSSLCQASSSGKSSASSRGYRKNIVMCLQGQESGFSWPLACSSGGYAGRNREKLIPFLEGWKSIGKQFHGPAVYIKRRCFASWIPTWCAYTSSVAVAQPPGGADQGVQKVLDVRFHPDGLGQLVCSSNEAPNELLLYNLHSGTAAELTGHNCQIQAIEYAVDGASVVSCGANILRVWDSRTGECLFTLGPTGRDLASPGHRKKINAMAVNHFQSCLVVTSGGEGDGKLLLWNVLTGESASDLNMNMRTKVQLFPSIDVMEFCSQNILVCGSDSAYGGPALVQLWDIEASQNCQSFPANDSYITSLKIDPSLNTIITGAGDGTVGLFDTRTCGAISRLSVGSSYEVTSVSFSSCGTYFHASSTSNNTLVWDTRLFPMNHGQMPMGKPIPVNDMCDMRPLHCLSHGKQMPTAEHTGQLPGHVDEGDQGVNDARWLHREPILVTVSGNGSIAMWDVTLGQPCIRHLRSHTRCANTVSVAPNDQYICSGGDDQKVVLYHYVKGNTHSQWRLTHPMTQRDLVYL
ncbi:hypothetical protein NE237_006755 [Protea cynaroides]|uniref:Uncharacterized protein n=1 Tax=Protea cynaroides TaxID=273540 RepID=A0A9Q0KNU3_9MAGN|nr:hypothetical protein NE237_006755 [Protea cynaroides]